MGSARRHRQHTRCADEPSPRSHEPGEATMTFTPAEQDAMTRALALAATAGVPLGPNPRVGCVLLDEHGATVAEGYHRGAGSPHAEADALARAGERARHA